MGLEHHQVLGASPRVYSQNLGRSVGSTWVFPFLLHKAPFYTRIACAGAVATQCQASRHLRRTSLNSSARAPWVGMFPLILRVLKMDYCSGHSNPVKDKGEHPKVPNHGGSGSSVQGADTVGCSTLRDGAGLRPAPDMGHRMHTEPRRESDLSRRATPKLSKMEPDPKRAIR